MVAVLTESELRNYRVCAVKVGHGTTVCRKVKVGTIGISLLALAIVLASAFACPLPAQQSAAPQSQTIQMECHDLSTSGNYVGPNETVINGRACHTVSAGSQATNSVATPPVQSDAAPLATPQKDELAPKGFLLEDATPVHLVLSENLSSASAVTGQTVEFEVVDDIVVGDLLVIPRGSTAWATVTDAKHIDKVRGFYHRRERFGFSKSSCLRLL